MPGSKQYAAIVASIALMIPIDRAEANMVREIISVTSLLIGRTPLTRCDIRNCDKIMSSDSQVRQECDGYGA